jgi:hypothetical protein
VCVCVDSHIYINLIIDTRIKERGATAIKKNVPRSHQQIPKSRGQSATKKGVEHTAHPITLITLRKARTLHDESSEESSALKMS